MTLSTLQDFSNEMIRAVAGIQKRHNTPKGFQAVSGVLDEFENKIFKRESLRLNVWVIANAGFWD